MRRVKRAALKPAIHSLRGAVRGRLFRAWQAAAQRLRVMRATASACIGRLRQLALAQALAAWKRWAVREQRHRYVAAKMVLCFTAADFEGLYQSIFPCVGSFWRSAWGACAAACWQLHSVAGGTGQMNAERCAIWSRWPCVA